MNIKTGEKEYKQVLIKLYNTKLPEDRVKIKSEDKPAKKKEIQKQEA
jgi:hypothetical protein